jgi:hypothetical protein
VDQHEEVRLIAAQAPEGMTPDRNDDYVHGQGEWLFERDGGRRHMLQMRGDLILAPKAVARWQFVLESRRAWLGDRETAYVFGVAPSPYVVMSEKLPTGITLSGLRPVTQVMELLAQNDSQAPLVYPLDVLTEEKRNRQIFSSHDTRWNANGAFVAYLRLLDEIPPDVPVRALRRKDIGFVWLPTCGDLGHRRDPAERRRAMIGRPCPRAAQLLSDNGVEGPGRMLVTASPDAPETTCVLFGDWAAYRNMSYFAEGFRRMVFAHNHALDHDLIEMERPDVVIHLIDEAAMIEVPPDIEAFGTADLAARKLQAGSDAMPTLAPLWGQLEPVGDAQAA